MDIGNESGFDTEWSPDLDPDDLRELQAAQRDPSKLIAKLPKESARLGYFSTFCLIANRLIGKVRKFVLDQKKSVLTSLHLDRNRGLQLSNRCVPQHSECRPVPYFMGLRCHLCARRCYRLHRARSHHSTLAIWAEWRKNIYSTKWRRAELCLCHRITLC